MEISTSFSLSQRHGLKEINNLYLNVQKMKFKKVMSGESFLP